MLCGTCCFLGGHLAWIMAYSSWSVLAVFCCSSAYLGSEIEVLSGMFTWIARLRVSVRTCFLSGRYPTLRSHPLNFRIMTCNLNGAAVIGLWSIVSRGLWSVCIIMVFPRMYSLNFCVLKIWFPVFSSLWVTSWFLNLDVYETHMLLAYPPARRPHPPHSYWHCIVSSIPFWHHSRLTLELCSTYS